MGGAARRRVSTVIADIHPLNTTITRLVISLSTVTAAKRRHPPPPFHHTTAGVSSTASSSPRSDTPPHGRFPCSPPQAPKAAWYFFALITPPLPPLARCWRAPDTGQQRQQPRRSPLSPMHCLRRALAATAAPQTPPHAGSKKKKERGRLFTPSQPSRWRRGPGNQEPRAEDAALRPGGGGEAKKTRERGAAIHDGKEEGGWVRALSLLKRRAVGSADARACCFACKKGDREEAHVRGRGAGGRGGCAPPKRFPSPAGAAHCGASGRRRAPPSLTPWALWNQGVEGGGKGGAAQIDGGEGGGWLVLVICCVCRGGGG